MIVVVERMNVDGSKTEFLVTAKSLKRAIECVIEDTVTARKATPQDVMELIGRNAIQITDDEAEPQPVGE